MNLENEKIFHLRARAILRNGNKFLAVKRTDADYCFLPGGHHEVGETIENTIIREMEEEAGLLVEVRQYLGIVEANWLEGSVEHYEINHVFEILAPELKLDSASKIISKEKHIEFFWLDINDIEKYDFLPEVARPLITNWFNGDKIIWHKSK